MRTSGRDRPERFFYTVLYRASFGVLVGTKTSSNRAIDDKVLAIRKKLSYNSQAFGKTSSITATERCPSWPKEHDWKSCVRHKRTVGSNPTLSANQILNRTPEFDLGFFIDKINCFCYYLSIPFYRRFACLLV